MNDVAAGRYTAQIDEQFVVFLISMRVNYEAVYGNMPIFGLAKAAQHVPATGNRLTAQRRLSGENEPEVATSESYHSIYSASSQ